MAKYTKQQAISIIIDCAVNYKENLDGYQLLFILKDKHKHISSLEVSLIHIISPSDRHKIS